MTRFEATVHEDVREVDPAEWDALMDPGNRAASHRFVALCQDARVEDSVYRHLVVREGGRAVLAASFSFFPIRLDLLADPPLQGVSKVVRRVLPRFLTLPVLLGGLPASFGQSCLGMAPGTDDAGAVAVLAEEAGRVARSLGASLVAFKEFTPAEDVRMRHLCDHGYFRAQSMPSCVLRLPYSCFEAYEACMRHPYRRQLRAARRRQEALGLEVRLERGTEEPFQVFQRLYDRVIDRAAQRLERLNAAFFRGLPQAFPEAAQVLFVSHEGRDVAASLLLDAPEQLSSLVSGLDDAHPLAHDAYHALMTAMVDLALRTGRPTLEMGQTTWASKTRLGAEIEPRTVYVLHRSRATQRVLSALRDVLFPPFDVGPRRRVFRDAASAERRASDVDLRPT